MATQFHYNTDGFVLDVAYTSDLLKVLSAFSEHFPGLAVVHVTLHERSFAELNYDLPSKPLFTFDGDVGKVYFTAQRYYKAKGKVTSTPSPFDVFQSLRYCMNKASEEYTEAISKINGDRT